MTAQRCNSGQQKPSTTSVAHSFTADGGALSKEKAEKELIYLILTQQKLTHVANSEKIKSRQHFLWKGFSFKKIKFNTDIST